MPGGGGAYGTKRQKTKTDSSKSVGGKSGKAEPKYTGAPAQEEGSPLSGLAGGRSEERMEADGEADGAAWDFD